MYKVLIADDENIIRKGLCSIIDWNSLGFEIAGEAANGKAALDFILENNPDLVMIDIRMPKLHGLDAIKEAREQGYTGKVIVLSGYSDFSYAQTAIKHGVVSYLVKPVDTNELTESLKKIKAELDTEKKSAVQESYATKAKEVLIREFVIGELPFSDIRPDELGLTHDLYQVILYEKYSYNSDDISYNFCDLLRVTNQNSNAFELIEADSKNIILLKGAHTIDKFNALIDKYNEDLPPEKNSPLDTIFITSGHPVSNVEEIPDSYQEAHNLLMHRFFCDQHQHIMEYNSLPDLTKDVPPAIPGEISAKYIKELVNHIQSYNRNKIATTLHELQNTLYTSNLSVEAEKNLLVDLYLQIKEKIYFLYSTTNIPFIANSEAVNFILQSYYLYEIITFLSEQFEMIMTSIGYSSRDSIIDDIVHYINHNYSENITLENIAPLFGYNSSYLGKIFSKKMGINFNSYLDNIRIEHSKELLLKDKTQVYKIAEIVGYRNVDYFHIKFKKNTGISPAEFRRQNKDNAPE